MICDLRGRRCRSRRGRELYIASAPPRNGGSHDREIAALVLFLVPPTPWQTPVASLLYLPLYVLGCWLLPLRSSLQFIALAAATLFSHSYFFPWFYFILVPAQLLRLRGVVGVCTTTRTQLHATRWTVGVAGPSTTLAARGSRFLSDSSAVYLVAPKLQRNPHPMPLSPPTTPRTPAEPSAPRFDRGNGDNPNNDGLHPGGGSNPHKAEGDGGTCSSDLRPSEGFRSLS